MRRWEKKVVDMIGKLERMELRKVWSNEATKFTPWLQENITVLGQALDISFSSVEREMSTGNFNADLLAETETGETVIIESQYGRSDHDHLGKVLTYLTSFEAKIAIWIVEEPRTEHVKAINWLNESSSGSFYLVKVEAVRIGDSPPAPLFTLIVGPSEESRVVGATKKELVERHILRKRFWTALLEKANQKTSLHANRSPSTDGALGAGSGKSGLGFNYVVHQNGTRVELFINRGGESEVVNKKIFDHFMESKDRIEESFGELLKWERMDGKQSCRISHDLKLGGWRDEDKWPEVHDAMVDAMIRFEKALRPFINSLKV